MLELVQHVVAQGPAIEISRTEDMKFSPSGRLLAVVNSDRSIFLFTIDVESRPIRVGQCTELVSTSMAYPHGIDFLTENLVVVANRAGNITFYRLPDVDAWRECTTIEPIHGMDCEWFGSNGATRALGKRSVRCGPGSVRVYGKELFVCCNNLNTVTVHSYQLQNGEIVTGEGKILAQDGLDIPDGVALSQDGRWMAIADSMNNRVVVYRREDLTISCELRDVDLRYPHGLCFGRNGRSLYVSDAGSSLVYVFATGDIWDKGETVSAFKMPAVDADAFRKTRQGIAEHLRPLEGGMKGIDVDPSGRIVAVTCSNQTLRFFEIQPSTP